MSPREARFLAFHETNPHVYVYLVQQARRWKAAGNARCGIRMLWENLRFDIGVRTIDVKYKLNDHYTSFYARLIDAQEPDLKGLFELRHRAETDMP